MVKSVFFSGIGLMAISGILFTFERFLAIFEFAIYSFDETVSTVPVEPPMPGLFDNFFVWFFLLIGLVFILFAFSTRLKEK